MADAPQVPGSAPGKAPAKAPSQTMPITGKGTVAKTQPTHQHQPPGPMAPPPPSAGSTGPVKAGPSVDYHTQQGNRPRAAKPGGSLSGQQQQLTDKGGQ